MTWQLPAIMIRAQPIHSRLAPQPIMHTSQHALPTSRLEAQWPLCQHHLQSWLHGKMVRAAEPEAVALGTSRGYETPTSKALLRWTVVLSDIATFFPATSLAMRLLSPPGSDGSYQPFVLAALLLQPAHLLVDHGHFQYNCISLGLTLAAAVVIAAKRQHVLGSVLFCAALCHKQMSLFYAPAFFAHLLGRCLQQQGMARKVSFGWLHWH